MPKKKPSPWNPATYLKAVVAFLAPVLTQFSIDIQGGVSVREVALNITTGLLTALVVWAVPNVSSG